MNEGDVLGFKIASVCIILNKDREGTGGKEGSVFFSQQQKGLC